MPPEVQIAPGSFDDDISEFNRPDQKRKSLPQELKRTGYTLQEIAKHSSHDDCWIIIRNKVYDVTSFVDKHPGGPLIYSGAGK